MGGEISSALIAGAVVVVVYAVLSRGIFRAAEPLRRKALELAAELIASSEISDLDKRVIRKTLFDFHSSLAAWGMAVRGVAHAFTWTIHRPKYDDPLEGLSPEVAAKFDRYMIFWMISTLANSVGAFAVFFVASLLGTAFSSAGGWVRATFATSHDHRNGDNGTLGKASI